MEKQPDMQLVGEVIGSEYVRSPQGSADTFLKMHRLLLGLSALSEQECFTAAQRIFPQEFAAYEKAVAVGQVAPLILGKHAGRFSVIFPELN